MASVNLVKLNKLVEEKLLSCQKHPTLPLLIWNYTPVTQYSKAWTEETLMCRGLITDVEGKIIARPFKKFFNYEEHIAPLPEGWPEIIEKMDGSLGIVFWYEDAWHVATRGSFTSDQAFHAALLLTTKYKDAFKDWPKDETHLFEILFPSNRIVVDYGSRDELVYLGSIHTSTGGEREIDDSSPFSSPLRIGFLGLDLMGLKELPSGNAEGFVLKWPNGFRLKLKFEEYKRLHRILTGTSNIAIWEMMLKREPMDAILEKVPDEFYDWVKKTMEDLQRNYDLIKDEMQDLIDYIEKKRDPNRFPDARKRWAKAILDDGRWPSVAFALLDKKDPHEIIMRLIRPEFSKPFKIEE